MDSKMHAQETASDQAVLKKEEAKGKAGEAMGATKEAMHERKEAERGRMENAMEAIGQKTGSLLENVGQKIKGDKSESTTEHPLQATAGTKDTDVDIEGKTECAGKDVLRQG